MATGRLGTVTRRGMQRVMVRFVGGGELLCPVATLELMSEDTDMNVVRYKRGRHRVDPMEDAGYGN